MKLFRKYPRVVEFENGKFGVQVGLNSYQDKDNLRYQWVTKSTIRKYCLVDTADEAIALCKLLNINIKRQVYP